METIPIADKPVKLDGARARCLVSLSSLGLVSQLACDLLLGACELERVAYLSSNLHVPCVSAVDSVAGQQVLTGVSTPIELYYSSLHSLALVHQRAPPLKSQKEAFVQALVEWIQKQQFSAVLLLGSMDAATRRDEDLSSGLLRHLTFSNSGLTLADGLRGLCSRHHNASTNGATDVFPLIPAGGLMRRLMIALSEVQGLDGGALLLYVVEGDNREDANVLAKAALKVLDINARVGKQPRSWKAGLYGSSQPQELFGASYSDNDSPSMKCIRGVIFDLDGLLLDSERVYSIVGQELLTPYGLTFDYTIKAAMMGLPALEAMQRLIDQTGIPLTATEALARQDERKDELFRQVQPLPGAMKLLKHLRKHGIPVAIATGSRAETFELKTSHLPELLACFPDKRTIVTADKVQPGRGKPEPDQFLMAAESINVRPADCLVFEDGLPGIEGARRGGIASVWVPDAELRAYRNATEPHIPENSLGQSEILASLEGFVPEQYGLPAYDAS